MSELLNFILVLLTLIFYLNNTIEKFKPCLNIILVALLLIAYSMSNITYLLGAIIVLLVFHFFMPNRYTQEGFKVSYQPTYHLIDDLDTILESDTSMRVKYQLTNKDLDDIKKTGTFTYPGETSKKDLTDDGWRICKNINNVGKQEDPSKSLHIYKVKKVGDRYMLVRLGRNQTQYNDDDDENEEEIILNRLVKENEVANAKEIKAVEGFKSKRSKSKDKKNSKRKSKSKKKRKDYGFDQKFNADETFINNKETLADVYRSLDPEQSRGMNSDTKELLETQKNLMNTLKNMGPVLTQGKDIMNTFNKYFGKTK